MHTAQPKTKSPLLYIMAPSYTGSTLLTYLLAMHPRIATIGELKASAMGDINTYHCSCGELLCNCPFWKRVVAMAREQGLGFDLDDFGTHFRAPSLPCDRLLHAGYRGEGFEILRSIGMALTPACRERFREVLHQNYCLVEIVKQLQERDVFLDGSKDPNRLRYFHGAGLWNIRAIYLIRDGRGTANSYMKHNNVSMETAAREWVFVHREADFLTRLLGDKVLTIHYETLCREPDRTLSEIFRFVELESDEISRDFRSVEHHILGNAMRMSSTGEIRLDEKWKIELSRADLTVFERIAGPLNRSYGY